MIDRMIIPTQPLLRVPPFPGARPGPFAKPALPGPDSGDIEGILDEVSATRTGGTYWGRRPPLPEAPYTLICLGEEKQRSQILASIPAGQPAVCFTAALSQSAASAGDEVEWLFGCCDPWHLLDGAAEVFADADDELALLSALAGKTTHVVDASRFRTLHDDAGRREFARGHRALRFSYVNPFTAEPLSFSKAVEVSAFWKRSIDSNRPLVAAVGFAHWKRPTVAPLLWAGSGEVPFVSNVDKVRPGDQVAAWKSRIPARTWARLQRSQANVVEVEDGFIRSVGLGADCVPPLSLVVDRLGAYFDPSRPSELEGLIQEGGFEPSLIERASRLRRLIVEQGVSKYSTGHAVIERPRLDRPHLLVIGQVEDDRSMVAGGGAVATNLELLARVRAFAPVAFISYKPHPDVVAGHRTGAIAKPVALALADEIADDQPIGALIDMADEVHVTTSLAGFEALLRGRIVVTHGVPFYAGWGLTRDLGRVPDRRSARRTLDELVAAVLLLYPRYLDPISGLPCPPEILIHRLANRPRSAKDGVLVNLRRMQGRLKRGLVSLRESVQ